MVEFGDFGLHRGRATEKQGTAGAALEACDEGFLIERFPSRAPAGGTGSMGTGDALGEAGGKIADFVEQALEGRRQGTLAYVVHALSVSGR